MRKLLSFFAYLMLILASWSGMAHAAEAAGPSDTAYEFSYHASGDGDEVPGDADNGLPHHHNVCHDLATPQTVVEQAVAVSYAQIRETCRVAPMSPADDDVTPRPPRT